MKINWVRKKEMFGVLFLIWNEKKKGIFVF